MTRLEEAEAPAAQVWYGCPSYLAPTESHATANPTSRAAKEAKLRLPLRYAAAEGYFLVWVEIEF